MNDFLLLYRLSVPPIIIHRRGSDNSDTIITCQNPTCPIGTYHKVCYNNYLPVLPVALRDKALRYWSDRDNILITKNILICDICHLNKYIQENPVFTAIVTNSMKEVDMTLITDAMLTDTSMDHPVPDAFFRT